jgi:hypothetical protein
MAIKAAEISNVLKKQIDTYNTDVAPPAEDEPPVEADADEAKDTTDEDEEEEEEQK